MSDSIGILGRAAATTVGTTTAFTCPAGFAAKGRLMFQGLNAGVGNATLEIIVGGIPVFTSGNVATSNYIYSFQLAGAISSGTQTAAPDGTTAAKTCAPALPIFFLNPGDTVQYIIGGNAFANMQVQFVGVLIDLSQ